MGVTQRGSMTYGGRLSSEDIEAIARRVAELVGPRGRTGLVGVDRICRDFGVSRSWVYAHARQLGAIRLGPAGVGRKPRLRFDLERASEAIRELSGEDDNDERRPAQRRKPEPVPPGVELIEPHRVVA
jgi:hypothetical protein